MTTMITKTSRVTGRTREISLADDIGDIFWDDADVSTDEDEIELDYDDGEAAIEVWEHEGEYGARVTGNFRRQTGARLTEIREQLRNAGISDVR